MNEAIATIAVWVLLALALWGTIDLMNRLSAWADKTIKRLIH
jgi:hypothetical protein